MIAYGARRSGRRACPRVHVGKTGGRSIVDVESRGEVKRPLAAAARRPREVALEALAGGMQAVDGHRVRGAAAHTGQLTIELVEPAKMRERPGNRAHEAAVIDIDKRERQRRRRVAR